MLTLWPYELSGGTAYCDGIHVIKDEASDRNGQNDCRRQKLLKISEAVLANRYAYSQNNAAQEQNCKDKIVNKKCNVCPAGFDHGN
jgi:hypothetical protein